MAVVLSLSPVELRAAVTDLEAHLYREDEGADAGADADTDTDTGKEEKPSAEERAGLETTFYWDYVGVGYFEDAPLLIQQGWHRFVDVPRPAGNLLLKLFKERLADMARSGAAG
jgi:hypothetical protein